MKKIIPISGGIDSCYLLHKAIMENHEVYPVLFDDGNNEHSEYIAALDLIDYYREKNNFPVVALRIPELNLLKVSYPITPMSEEQIEAMSQIDYWSGYKALFYATTLAYGGAIGADQIEFGVYEWNNHFVDELPESAYHFRNSWVKMYPDLKVPNIVFPLIGRRKADIIKEAAIMGLPFNLTYSCFEDNGPCGECLGCVNRRDEFLEAGIKDE